MTELAETAAATTVPANSAGRALARVSQAAVRPVNSASSAVFRIAFGLGMTINVSLYLPVLVQQYYNDTTFNFTYGPFTFVQPLPGPGMHLAYGAMWVLGLLIAAGKWYRPAITSFFVIATYVFLVDSTYFQNHEYLISLLAFLMIFLPLDRRWSLDARRHRDRASSTVPAWVVWLLRFQIGVPYFFGGIAKLNSDWLQGEPLRRWLADRTDIAPINAILTNEPVVWTMTYGSLVLDLVIVWLLLYRPTRLLAFIIVTGFHLINVWLFGLFIFPWLMIAATTMFFDPAWPEPPVAWVRRRWEAHRSGEPVAQAATGSGGLHAVASPDRASRTFRPVVAGLLLVWVTVQIAAPMRHLLIEGNPSWTEQAHRFAWHMKLRDKQGTVTFLVTAGGRTIEVDPRDHLNDKQVFRLAGHPERLVLFARHLSDLHDGAEVRADTNVSLNGRAPQPIVDPTVDLASVPLLRWANAPWILPLEESLPR